MSRLALVLLVACASLVAAAGMLSVSGLSSGAFAAVQFQVAYSKTVHGVGVVAGGPYYCAMDTVIEALTSCLTQPELIDLTLIEVASEGFQAESEIDNTQYLADARVWLYSSADDTVVLSGVVNKLEAFYQAYHAEVVGVYNHSSEHGMPTLNYGIACDTLGSPFILNCNYDAAGALLQHIYNNTLNASTTWQESQIQTLSQQKYLAPAYADSGLAALSLNDNAYVFVPSGCSWPAPTGCDVHVVLHGCEQSVNDINMTYVLHTGYNGWGEANNIVILYPQIVAHPLTNPDACIDWWGYIDSYYATNKGAQNSLFWNMAQALLGSSSD